MKKKVWNEMEMGQLLADVEATFSANLKKAEETKVQAELAKSEENTEIPAANVAEVEVAKAESDLDYDDADLKEMDELYSTMSKAEKEVHFKAVKKALFGEIAEVQKSEVPVVIDTKETDLLKSEIELTKKENDDLKKSLEKLTAAMTKFVKSNKAPERKGITEIQFVAKSEAEVKKSETDTATLTKSEIDKRLNAKIRSGSLTQKDKDSIISYYDKPSLELIKHLL